MKKRILLTLGVEFGLLSVLMLPAVCRTAHSQELVDLPAVFQAAGPTASSIQSTVDAFRAALGEPNNANSPGPVFPTGRREINWDGGGNNDTTTAPVTPFNVFLDTRGAQFTTPGVGLSQAPPAGGATNGLVGLFNNPTYGTIFTAFSPLRLFTPVGSRVTEGLFFVPGFLGNLPATVRGFGAVLPVGRAGWSRAQQQRRKPWWSEHSDQVLRCQRRANIHQFRARLAGQRRAIVLRYRVPGCSHRAGPSHNRQYRARTG